MHIGQAEVAAGMAEGEFFVVEAQQVKNRGVEIVDVDFLFGGGKTEFIGSAMDVSSFHTAAGHPHCEAVIVVVAPVDFTGIGTRGG